MRHSALLAFLLLGPGAALAQSAEEGEPQELPAAAQSMQSDEGFSEVAFDELTPENLTGVILFGADGGEIGPVSTVLSAEDGIGDVIVDVGGLINLAETPLAFQPMDMVALRSEEGELRLVSRMTQADIEAVAATTAN